MNSPPNCVLVNVNVTHRLVEQLVVGNMAVAQKKRYQNGTLVSGNMDQHLRNPSCLILSHTHMVFSESSLLARPKPLVPEAPCWLWASAAKAGPAKA